MNGLKSFDLPDYQEDDVRLQAMELSMPLLQEIVALIAQAVRHASPLEPANYRGQKIFGEGQRIVRERLLSLGGHWQTVKKGNDEQTVNTKVGYGLTVKKGDKRTGILSTVASQQSRIGKMTHEAVEINGQLSLFPGEEIAIGQRPRWYLLVYVTADTVRAELSLPVRANEKAFTAFAHRIIIPTDELLPVAISVVQDSPPIDIPVGIKTTS